MRGFRLSLLAVAIAVFAGSCAHQDTSLCDNVILKQGKLRLSKNEKVLVCGSHKAKEGWRDVPLPQAQYQLKILLQEKGYFNPRFERDRDWLYVWAGERGDVKKFTVEGDGGELRPDKKRHVEGEPLTPDLLDTVDTWAETKLRSQAHACPEVDVKAQAWDSSIVAHAKPGGKQWIRSLERSGLEGLDPEALLRYQAFEVGEPYNILETQLTTSRMLNAGLFESAYITTDCHGEMVDLHLRTVVGKPRLLTFGVGGSTEQFPFVQITLKNSRLDDRASSLRTELFASPIRQTLDVTSELYILPWSKRSYFGPRFLVQRRVEDVYEVNEARLGADIGRHWDMWNTRFRGRFGPTLNYTNTVVGVGPEDTKYLSWEGSLLAMSHLYEVYMRDQHEGWQAQVSYRGQRKGVASPINVDRYEADFKYLWNLGNYSPPLLVLASRFQLTGVNANKLDQNETRNLLPHDYRIFKGGDEDLRGFSRQSLNNKGLGYLTSAYAGFELRLIEELPWKLEPFLLWDLARLGNERFNLDEPVFESAGLGIRWASPFGTLRGSAARGRIFMEDKSTKDYSEEWVYFFSFGQEF